MASPAMMGMGLVGGGVLSAASGIAGGVAADRTSRNQAHLIKQQGRIAEADERRIGRDLEGAQRAASTTADANTGSALDIQLDTVVENELAALRARFGFDRRAKVVRDAGKSALTSSIVSGAGSILGASIQAGSLQPRAGSSPVNPFSSHTVV